MSDENVRNEVTVAPFESKDVRVIWRDEAPWFCAKDICTILQIKNSQDTRRKLDDDEVCSVVLNHAANGSKTLFVSEPGLYHLILSARKNELVAPFHRWVTHDVLPTIRRTGAYAMLGTEAAEYIKCKDAEARHQFGVLKFAIAQMMYNDGWRPEEIIAAVAPATMELAKGIALNYDAARWEAGEYPAATSQRLGDNWQKYRQFKAPTRMELIAAKGGFLN